MAENNIPEKRKISYQKTFLKYGPTFKALQWKDEKAAFLRYENLIKDLEFEGKKIVDVGCGFGDIILFIRKKAKNFRYIGIDIVPEFIKEAKKRYPEGEFIVGDYHRKIKKADIILCSGVLNRKSKNPYRERFKEIEFLFSFAQKALAFNMAGSFPQPENLPHLKVYYADALKILRFCLGLSGKVVFRSDYHPKDFTITIFKNT